MLLARERPDRRGGPPIAGPNSHLLGPGGTVRPLAAIHGLSGGRCVPPYACPPLSLTWVNPDP
eukprot:7222-Pyramimonas_sp.AAC.1